MVKNSGDQTERTSPEEAAELRQSPFARVTVLLYQRDGATTVYLRAGVPVVIGRDAAADVCLDDRSLSRKHASFLLSEDGSVTIEDLGSTNGTWVGGRRVTKQTIAFGAEAAFGSVIASVHTTTRADGGSSSILGHEQLRMVLDAELVRARFFGRPLGFALMRPLGNDGAPPRKWIPLIQQRLRPVDQVAVYGRDTLELVIPEMDEAQAQRFLLAVIDGIGSPGLVCGVASSPVSGRSADELVEAARNAMLRADSTTRVVSIPAEGAAGVRSSVASRSGGILTENPAMRAAIQTLERAAKSTIPVLLIGETGSGKEVLARHLHQASNRRDAPMISVNCGAIPETLVESTLFGHERGAFTGASQQQNGVFAAASGGIVFLDEVGELPAAAQAALLRVLETKKIVRVGSTKELSVDVRIVAATHRDLTAMVRDGRFRQDLLYRLNALVVTVPSLRERPEDIAPLSRRLLAEATAETGAPIDDIEPDALALLRRYRWPGNVRELKNAIERALVLADGRTIRVEDLPMDLVAAGCPDASDEAGTPIAEVGENEDFRTRVDRFEAEILSEALRRADWNQRVAARRLGLPLRTLVYKIRVLNLRRPNAVPVRPSR